ncbi:MAG: hypothetical protein LBE61_19185 [Burkholderiaceae bacterium]|nr:hypothetical protein [Burkholderiaceae bacterium]
MDPATDRSTDMLQRFEAVYRRGQPLTPSVQAFHNAMLAMQMTALASKQSIECSTLTSSNPGKGNLAT